MLFRCPYEVFSVSQRVPTTLIDGSSSRSRLADGLPDPEAMAVGRVNREFTHAPRLVRDGVNGFQPRAFHVGVICVHVVNSQVSEIVVTAQLTRVHVVRT